MVCEKDPSAVITVVVVRQMRSSAFMKISMLLQPLLEADDAVTLGIIILCNWGLIRFFYSVKCIR